ncbi:MAG: alpha-mannosidase [Firmicutes bacterium]|nr:alpha-mannosidase [Bacillota bacterium]
MGNKYARTNYTELCKQELEKLNIREGIDITFHMVHMNHLDMIWYWRLPDTIEMCLETIKWNVELLETQPDAKYTHAQVFTLKVIEELDKELFERFKKLVRQGRIEIDSGQVVEPDHNIPCGESIVRQFLYGQRYVKKHFGDYARICINSDSFGHSRSLPQILKKCGIDAFIFKRPVQSVADLPEVPFTWKGIDGTAIFAMRFNNKGNGLPNLSKGTQLKEDENPLQLKVDLNLSAGISDFFGPHCISDAGGVAPYVEPCKGERYTLKYSTPSEFYNSLMEKKPVLNVMDVPLNRGMEGCYTTHIGEKENLRRAERELRQVELLWSLAALLGYGYPYGALESNWWRFSLMQFHDALPGSTSDKAYNDDMAVYHELFLNMKMLRRKAQLILDKEYVQGSYLRSFLVVNPRMLHSGGIVETDIDMMINRDDPGDEPNSMRVPKSGILKTLSGAFTPYQIIEERTYQRYVRGRIIFDAGNLPPFMPEQFNMAKPGESSQIGNGSINFKSFVKAEGTIIENEYLKVDTGGPGIIRSILKKTSGYEYLKSVSSAVRIELWPEPRGDCYSLGIDGHRYYAMPEGEITLLENGPVRATLRKEYRWGKSKFITDISLYAGHEWVELRLKIDWNEKETLARLCIEPNLNEVTYRKYGIPFGCETATGKEIEIPVVGWAAIGNEDIGMAIIDRDRPGHTFVEDMLRVSIVRCSTRPFDPCSDSGEINACFRIVPYEGGFETSGIPAIADEFCHPALAWQACCKNSKDSSYGMPFPPFWLDGDGIITSSFKVSENKDGYILRLYESLGKISKTVINLSEKLYECKIYETNLLEEEEKKLNVKNNKVEVIFMPFEIKTLLFKTAMKIPPMKEYNHESVFWQEVNKINNNVI